MFEKIWERMSCAISEQACGPLMRSPRAPHVVPGGAVLVTPAPDKPKRLGVDGSVTRGNELHRAGGAAAGVVVGQHGDVVVRAALQAGGQAVGLRGVTRRRVARADAGHRGDVAPGVAAPLPRDVEAPRPAVQLGDHAARHAGGCGWRWRLVGGGGGQ